MGKKKKITKQQGGGKLQVEKTDKKDKYADNKKKKGKGK